MKEKSVDILPVISWPLLYIDLSICYSWCIREADISQQTPIKVCVNWHPAFETFFHSCFISELGMLDYVNYQSKS